MGRDTQYERYLLQLERDIEQRSERCAAAWRRLLPFLDPVELRLLGAERRAREAALEEQLRQLQQRRQSRG